MKYLLLESVKPFQNIFFHRTSFEIILRTPAAGKAGLSSSLRLRVRVQSIKFLRQIIFTITNTDIKLENLWMKTK